MTKLHVIVLLACYLNIVQCTESNDASIMSYESCKTCLCKQFNEICYECEQIEFNFTDLETCPIEQENNSTDHDHHTTHVPTVMLFPWLAQLMGVLTMHILSRFAPDLPYTAVLFVLGVLLGVVITYVPTATGQLHESVAIWTEIDPHLLLYAFLPALLFGDAFEVNWYLFKKGFGQILWLAFPGMLFGTALTAIISYGILPYCWSFELCMTFGSILAATDPVAVMALLKEVGAAPSLQMVISGESMLNDGTAIVIFTIFSNMFLNHVGKPEYAPEIGNCTTEILPPGLNVPPAGREYTVGEGFGIFFQMSIGGALVGILMGFLTIMWMSFLNRKLEDGDTIMQLSLTLIVAYLTFYFAEAICGTSGVLAVVFCGVILAAFAKPLIVSRETLEHVWHAIEHLGNTLLFVLGGVMWGDAVAQGNEDNHITGHDFGYLIALYLVTMFVRVCMIGLSYPIISRFGLEITWKDACFMTWGGLRGAVGIALAVSLDNSVEQGLMFEGPVKNSAVRDAKRVLFFVGGIALLTLLINGTTSAFILRKLGLTVTTEARQSVLDTVHDKMILEAREAYERVKEMDYFSLLDQKAVETLVPCLKPGPTRKMSSLRAESQRQLSAIIKRKASTVDYNAALKYNRIVITLREIYLDLLRAAYWELIAEGVLREDSFAAYVLLQSCDISARPVARGEPLHDWKAVTSASNGFEYRVDRTIGWLIGKAPLLKRDDVKLKIEVQKIHTALCFIKAHQRAQVQLRTYYSNLDDTTDTSVSGCPREDDVIVGESELQVNFAAQLLDNTDQTLIRVTVNKISAAIVLEAQAQFIRKSMHHGMIHEKEAQVMLQEIQTLLAKLHWLNKRIFNSSLDGDAVTKSKAWTEKVKLDSSKNKSKKSKKSTNGGAADKLESNLEVIEEYPEGSTARNTKKTNGNSAVEQPESPLPDSSQGSEAQRQSEAKSNQIDIAIEGDETLSNDFQTMTMS